MPQKESLSVSGLVPLFPHKHVLNCGIYAIASRNALLRNKIQVVMEEEHTHTHQAQTIGSLLWLRVLTYSIVFHYDK